MTIPQIKHQLSKQYPLIKFKEEKEGDITFLFHNLEDEDLQLRLQQFSKQTGRKV